MLPAVASFAEAWIEIAPSPAPPKEEAVASFAEAWIEIYTESTHTDLR